MGGAEYWPRLEAKAAPNLPPGRLLERHQAHDHVGLARHDAGGGQADGPRGAAPAPGEPGGEADLGDPEDLGGQPGVEPATPGEEGEPVDVLDAEPGIVDGGEDGLAAQLEFGQGIGLAVPVEAGGPHADDGRAVPDGALRHAQTLRFVPPG